MSLVNLGLLNLILSLKRFEIHSFLYSLNILEKMPFFFYTQSWNSLVQIVKRMLRKARPHAWISSGLISYINFQFWSLLFLPGPVPMAAGCRAGAYFLAVTTPNRVGTTVFPCFTGFGSFCIVFFSFLFTESFMHVYFCIHYRSSIHDQCARLFSSIYAFLISQSGRLVDFSELCQGSLIVGGHHKFVHMAAPKVLAVLVPQDRVTEWRDLCWMHLLIAINHRGKCCDGFSTHIEATRWVYCAAIRIGSYYAISQTLRYCESCEKPMPFYEYAKL